VCLNFCWQGSAGCLSFQSAISSSWAQDTHSVDLCELHAARYARLIRFSFLIMIARFAIL